jgi:signal recognition particle receptor subunit beta
LALINHRTHEIHFKIVYYGPGLCGKTTNLRSLHDRLPPERRGKMISIATDHERTLFFDFLPIDLGHVNGFLTRFHLYTVPGQVYYKLSRRAVLQGVDGLVFVADSHPAREAANRESLADLHEHLQTLGVTGPALARIPWVFQYNKRDSPVAVPIERLRHALNTQGWPEFEGVASEGKGVSETLRAACKAVLARLAGGQPPAPTPAAAAGPATSAPAVATSASLPPSAIATAPAAPVSAPAAAPPVLASGPPASAPPRLAPVIPSAATLARAAAAGVVTELAPEPAPPSLPAGGPSPPAIASPSPGTTPRP